MESKEEQFRSWLELPIPWQTRPQRLSQSWGGDQRSAPSDLLLQTKSQLQKVPQPLWTEPPAGKEVFRPCTCEETFQIAARTEMGVCESCVFISAWHTNMTCQFIKLKIINSNKRIKEFLRRGAAGHWRSVRLLQQCGGWSAGVLDYVCSARTLQLQEQWAACLSSTSSSPLRFLIGRF